jgi:hypothetical protein
MRLRQSSAAGQSDLQGKHCLPYPRSVERKREWIMARRAPHSFRTRAAFTAVIALAVWAVFAVAVPLAGFAPDARLFGLPLRAALAPPVGLPALVLTMAWFSVRQNRDDERFRNHD